MIRITFLCCLTLLLSTCSNQEKSTDTSKDLSTLSKAYHRQLMENEAELLETYFIREEFHVEMLWECTDKAVTPYPTLTLIYDSLKNEKDETLSSRGGFYAYADSLEKSTNGKSKSAQMDANKMIHAKANESLDFLEQKKSNFYSLEAKYTNTCEEYEIIRITHAQYADSLLSRMMQWEDSLMAQGGAIGKAKNALLNSDLEKRSKPYMKRYFYVSQMELQHKQFKSKLISLENQHARYDSARQDDFFYRGPAMAPRSDVDFSESEFIALKKSMIVFRDTEQQFYFQK